MSEAMSVKIGPSFFSKEFSDYSNWHWAYAREACQNGFDAPGSRHMHVTVAPQGEDTLVTFGNDGRPMDEETLVGKLLTMGESGKGFNGTTGGFGKAKLLLLFCHQSWSVRTGTLLAEGVGGGYALTRDLPYFHGTSTTVTMNGDQREQIEGAFRRFAQLSQWAGALSLNGETLETDLRNGHHRKDTEWCTIHTNRSHEGLVVVRVQGSVMFTRRTSFKGCVVVELIGTSAERLTSNRDGLRYQYAGELDAFLEQLAVDKKSALRRQKAEYKRYLGEQLKYEAARPKAAGNLLDLLVGTVELEEGSQSTRELAAFVRGDKAPQMRGGIAVEVVSREEVEVSVGPTIVIKNTTGMVVPDYYLPEKGFSDYSRKLILAWAKVMLELHRIAEHSAEFSIGLLLDEENAAEYEAGEYGRVYYLNPARLVGQRDKPQCRSFRKAFTGAWQDRFEILSLAVHEFVHGLGFGQHDEAFSSKLTEMTALVFANMNRLTPLFRS